MSVDGTWNITVNSPMGARESTFVLNADGGNLNGHGLAPDGGQNPIKDGVANGGIVSWKIDVISPMPMTLEFEGKVDGDEISGTTKAGAFGSMPFKGQRA